MWGRTHLAVTQRQRDQSQRIRFPPPPPRPGSKTSCTRIYPSPPGLIHTAPPRLLRSASSSDPLLPALLCSPSHSHPSLAKFSTMDVQAELRRPAAAAAAHEAALRAAQKPPAKPWRGGSSSSSSAAPPPPPPKVYRVEPREFRDLVQRLTGAPPAAVARPQHHQVAAVQPVPVRASGDQQQHHHQQQQQQFYSSPWFSFPLGGVDGANGLM